MDFSFKEIEELEGIYIYMCIYLYLEIIYLEARGNKNRKPIPNREEDDPKDGKKVEYIIIYILGIYYL